MSILPFHPSIVDIESESLFSSGDACHPMLPYLAQGANSAIEDGAVLGLLLGKIRSKQQLPQALMMYERLRKARGETIAKESFKQASFLENASSMSTWPMLIYAVTARSVSPLGWTGASCERCSP